MLERKEPDQPGPDKNKENQNELNGPKNSEKPRSPEELTGIKYPEKKANREVELKGIKYPTKLEPIFEDLSDNLLYKLNNYALLVNKLDYYGNAIPLGAFCYAISFIMYGFFNCKVHNKENQDSFFYIIILLFGGFGQILAGLLEYIKGRTFPSNLYIIFGIYFICLYYLEFYNRDIFISDCKKIFYATWAILSFPIFIGSSMINVWFLVQTFIACAIFVLRCIGECLDVTVMKDDIVQGVLELVTGFISLYICFYQIINEALKFPLLPVLSLQKDNEIDISKQVDNNS